MLTNDQFFTQLGNLLGGTTGAGLSVLALVGIKVLALAFNWKFGEWVGMWRLTIISGLTVLTVIVVNLSRGVPPFGAVVNGTVFAAISVFINNFWKQWKNLHPDIQALKTQNDQPQTVVVVVNQAPTPEEKKP